MNNPKEIFNFIDRKYGFNKQDLRTKSRKHPLCEVRQIAMFLFRVRLDFNYSRIGRYFDKDHSTASHAYHIISQRLKDKDLTLEGVDISKLEYHDPIKTVDSSLNDALRIFKINFKKAFEDDPFGMMMDVNEVINKRLSK